LGARWGMTTSSIVPAGAGEDAAPEDARLSPPVAAYPARFRGPSREHADSDLRATLGWCAERGIRPLGAQRRQPELYMRWMHGRPLVDRVSPSSGARGIPSAGSQERDAYAQTGNA